MRREIAAMTEWMPAERTERVRLLAEYYAGKGFANPQARAERFADHPLENLRGDCEPIFQCLMRGESVPELAERLGMHRAQIYAYLLENDASGWAKYSAATSIDRLSRADEALDSAETNVEVGRNSAISRNQQWMLERMAPRLFGAKQEAGISISVNLDPSCGGRVVIDAGSESGAEALPAGGG